MERETIVGGDAFLAFKPNGVLVVTIRHHAHRTHAATTSYYHGHECGLTPGAGEMQPPRVAFAHHDANGLFLIRGFAERTGTDERDIVENVLWNLLHTPPV